MVGVWVPEQVKNCSASPWWAGGESVNAMADIVLGSGGLLKV